MEPLNLSRFIRKRLEERERAGHQVAVGVAGAGSFGRSLVVQLAQAPGMRPAVVADLQVDCAREAYLHAGYAAGDILCTESAGRAADAVCASRPVVVPDGALLADLPLDAVVDSTGLPNVGATVGVR